MTSTPQPLTPGQHVRLTANASWLGRTGEIVRVFDPAKDPTSPAERTYHYWVQVHGRSEPHDLLYPFATHELEPVL